MYLEVGTTIFIEIQEVQMMNGIYGDMTIYGLPPS